jgi:hypothetical protein
MNKLYYIVELHLDSSYSWNGLRTITGYMSELYTLDLTDEIQEKEGQFTIENKMVKLFEIVAKTDGDWQYLLSDEEEIQMWLDKNGYKNQEFEIIQL